MQMKTSGRLPLPSNWAPPPHPASVFKPNADTTFLDLAVETRMQIYGYILQEESPVELKLIFRRGAPREVARCGNQRVKHHRGEVWDAAERKWVPAPPTKTAVIFLNHQVYAEASQVLYSSNVFQFSTTTVLKDFLEHLGKRTMYVRHIVIRQGGYILSTVPTALRLLQQAEGLRTLEFAHSDFCHSSFGEPRVTVARLASSCKPLLKSLHAAYQAQKLACSVLDLVSISPSCRCHRCQPGAFLAWPWDSDEGRSQRSRCRLWMRCGCMCSEVEQKDGELRADLRSAIARVLGLSEDEGQNDL